MKKTIAIIITMSVLTVLVLSGCGKKSEAGSAGEVNVYNWGEYIDESIFDDFERETGIKINYSLFENNEQMYSALKMGGSNYDVIIPSDYMISRLISEGMLEKINFDNIPNYSLIDSKYKGLEYDPADEYSIAYMAGTVGIIYNSEKITDEITSWGALFDPAYSGQILMFDNPRDAMGIALKYLGYSLNTTSESELYEAYDLLVKQKPILQAYVMDQIFDKLESGEAAIGPYYSGDYLSMRENNPSLRFVIPEEGTNRFVDAMCIPKGASNKENAEAFINFMCSTEASLANMEMIGYASANFEAVETYSAELDEADIEIAFASEQIFANCEFFTNLPPNILSLYDTLWSTLKS